MSLLKDKHGAKSHGSDAASANVDAKSLHFLDKSGRVLGVKGNVGSIIKALVFVQMSVRPLAEKDTHPRSLPRRF